MEARFIERLVAIFERSTLAELDYSEAGTRIRLSRTSGPPGVAVERAQTTAAIAPDGPREAAGRDDIITAGTAGTFFRSPAPGAPPFVSVGDLVTEGQTLGILEAMKTLNPIEADRAGRVVDIMAEDGAAVDAGAPLLRIDGAG